ncbi:VOC family protein [Nocardiopsis composta]|uniref:Putative enzyme related to lactoylglutathione lyase n=1 Tax=Nocardiopsis composta TaxID=157465 RepID=A0A7W8QN01_9ACTN|nr:VOC family protein [Nocardiopsis composta]MBB5433457.1 putative enzyme related to lactoylglutathione lyase [Nocardiopsis composta]
MLKDIAITPMYVTDQDAALEFYVKRLGFAVDTDVDLGNMRWLTVALPSAPKRMVLLQRIGDTTATGSEETAERLRELTELGTTSWMILESDDVDAEHERLRKAGVEITEEPTTRPYGRDMAVRDPFGNQIRITQYLSE